MGSASEIEASSSTAEVKPAKEVVAISGSLHLGTRFYSNRTPPATNIEARVDFKTRRRRGMQAQFELKTDEDSRTVELNDGYVEWRENKESPWDFRFGYERRRLGIENQFGLRKRIGIERSPIYEELAAIQWFGKDPFARLTWSAQQTHSMGFYVGTSKDQSAEFSSEFPLSDEWTGATWVSVLRYARVNPASLYFFVGAGLSWLNSDWRTELEFLTGSNPVESVARSDVDLTGTLWAESLKSNLGSKRRHFAAARLGLSKSINQFRPFMHLSYFRPQYSDLRGERVSLVVGNEYSLAKDFQLIGEVDVSQQRSYVQTDVRSLEGSSARIKLRYFF